MATWAIGDVHGCYRTLQALLGRMDLDVRRDRLWMVGDLVNRGPRSLKVLRWAQELDKEMGDRFQVVLGNHDLHLIARHLGIAEARPRDTLDGILDAPEGPDLVEWLRRRPFVHFERVGDCDYVLVHAGLVPGWSAADALAASQRLGRLLRGRDAQLLLRRGSDPGQRRCRPTPPPMPSAGDPGARNRAALAAFTRTRMLDSELRPHEWSGPPEDAPSGLKPWYRVRPRSCPEHTIVCGHWAALGLRLEHDLIALDSGCAWGGPLTAIRLDDRRVVQEPRSDS